MQVLNVYGPPGSGKTSKLTTLFLQAIAIAGGPDRVAAVTYTRAAAQELRQRAGEALGLNLDPRALAKALPWVGTIHSLSYALSGRHKLATPEVAYAAISGGKYRESTGNLLDQSMLPYDGDLDEAALALRLEASARHRLVHPYDAIKTLPAEAVARTTPQRLFDLIRKYRAWKHDQGLIDYEDLLDLGKQHAPPVKALFVDEAQDNSRLLWSVIDAWMQTVELCVTVGDPWQSLYQFSGADPQGFRSRAGTWVSLGVSHRLKERDRAYAVGLLKRAGWKDPLIDSWTGLGKGVELADGSAFALARTHRLVGDYERQLIEQGIPFRRLAGKAPLEQDSLDAWRALGRLRDGETIPAYHLESLTRYAMKVLGPTRISAWNGLMRDPNAPVDPEQFQRVLDTSPSDVRMRLPWASYYNRVQRHHGTQALVDPPKLALGTIHCSPPDERVLTVNRGYVALENLQPDDRLLSYFQSQTRGSAQGYEFQIEHRDYDGSMVTIKTVRSVTRVTPNHRVFAYYAPDADETFVLYLMRSGSWWRIGQTRMRRVSGESAYGLTRRMGNEAANEAWIIGVYDTRQEAIYHEALLAATYGIPDTNFVSSPGRVKERLSAEDRRQIFDLAAPAVAGRALQLLVDLGLHPDLPFYIRGNRQLRSDRRGFDVHAANLHPRLFKLLTLDDDGQLIKEPFTLDRYPYRGVVYDLSMEKYPYYFSNGLLVHNSAKGLEADHVVLLRQWGTIPSRSLQDATPAADEACIAFVGTTRHRVSLKLVDAFTTGPTYPFS